MSETETKRLLKEQEQVNDDDDEVALGVCLHANSVEVPSFSCPCQSHSHMYPPVPDPVTCTPPVPISITSLLLSPHTTLNLPSHIPSATLTVSPSLPLVPLPLHLSPFTPPLNRSPALVPSRPAGIIRRVPSGLVGGGTRVPAGLHTARSGVDVWAYLVV